MSEDIFVIGIDGGGTRVRARLANAQGVVLGNGEAGTANPNALGFAAAQNEILLAIERAFADAHIKKRIVAATCFGIGGVDRADERARLTEWAQQAIALRAQVANDGEITIAAASNENWGAALIAGTGSSAWGKTRDGKLARAGGWGYLIGDEGSGFDLGREALRAITHSVDERGEPTQLVESILHFWNLQSPSELIARVYRSGIKPGDIAQLAPLVERAANEGDAVARRLIEQAGADLADTVIAVTRRLEFGAEKIPLGLTGGLLLESDLVRNSLLRELEKRGNIFSPITLVHEPVNGAVRIARGVVARGG